MVLIALGVGYVLLQPSTNDTAPAAVVETSADSTASEPAQTYPQYTDITNSSGFVNTDGITLEELVGEKVILVDFMTYSCINCIRTFPYLVAWYDAYKDQGLEIVGIHTPEFAFERDRDNVIEAMAKHGITFPIVLDNDYSTWRAYENRFWPRKYLIDINGNVVYDHIGEGAYDVTEAKIVELLEERAAKLGGAVEDKDIDVVVDAPERGPRSPETYLGASRGDYSLTAGTEFFVPGTREPNRAYLKGNWQVTEEYVQPTAVGSKIVYDFRAKNVFLVMTSETTGRVRVLVDGNETKIITIDTEDLYTLVDMPESGTHTLELEFLDTDVQAFAFTFG